MLEIFCIIKYLTFCSLLCIAGGGKKEAVSGETVTEEAAMKHKGVEMTPWGRKVSEGIEFLVFASKITELFSLLCR